MIRHTLSSWRVRVAGLCCTAAVVILAWTISDALRPPRPRPVAILASSAVPSRGERARAVSDDLVARAPDRDPFSARSSPALRSVESPPTIAPAMPTPYVLRLVGTVVDSSGGSFILCQLGASPTRVLRVGQEIGAYQLHSISQGYATFVTGDGQRLELRVPKTGS